MIQISVLINLTSPRICGRNRMSNHDSKGGLGYLFGVTDGRAPSFPDLSVGEALAPDPKDRENSGGGKFPSQISHRKDQPGSPGTEEKISQASHSDPTVSRLKC